MCIFFLNSRYVLQLHQKRFFFTLMILRVKRNDKLSDTSCIATDEFVLEAKTKEQ